MTTGGSSIESSSVFDPSQLFHGTESNHLILSVHKMLEKNSKTLRLKGLKEGQKISITFANQFEGTMQEKLKAIEEQFKTHKKYIAKIRQGNKVTKFASKEVIEGIKTGTFKLTKIKKAEDTTSKSVEPEHSEDIVVITDEAAKKIAESVHTLSLQAFGEPEEEVKPASEHKDTSTEQTRVHKPTTAASAHLKTAEHDDVEKAEVLEKEDPTTHIKKETAAEELKQEEKQLEEIQEHEKELRDEDIAADDKHVQISHKEEKLEERTEDAIQAKIVEPEEKKGADPEALP